MIDRRAVHAIIPCAGTGKRMGVRQKQFLEILNKPVLEYVLSAFETSAFIDTITIPTSPNAIGEVEELVRRNKYSKVKRVLAGGAHRQDSVWNGIQSLKCNNNDILIVHDGARPFVAVEIINKVVKGAVDFGGAISAVRSKDTIKLADDNKCTTGTLDKEHCWNVQTPQAFVYRILIDAFKKAFFEGFYGTDESSLVERIGQKVKIIEGEYENIKITTPEDIVYAQIIAERRIKK
ncbi:MAG: 2-C-methyl-D-erythritol 4-phosphate cytidylyltransferase [Bacteroidota bacterium]